MRQNSSLGYFFKALGHKPVPSRLNIDNIGICSLKSVFKHDFFACTALYTAHDSSKIIVKFNRTSDFIGFPLKWLGIWLCQNELKILNLIHDIEDTPYLIARVGHTGFAYRFIEGDVLAIRPQLPDTFFDDLEILVSKLHSRNIVYLDMNKRGNIILGDDGKPKLVDFQISQYINWVWPVKPLGSLLLKMLIKEDIYHIRKHKRRLAKHLMTPAQIAASRRVSLPVRIHRFLTRPLTRARRAFLYFLHKKHLLITDDIERYHCESDPARWRA